MLNFIDSTSNVKIKHAAKLATSSKYRKENGEFFLEGLRLCFDAVNGGIKTESVFFTEKAYEKSKSLIDSMILLSDNAYTISQSVCAKLSQTQTSQGVFAVCKMRSHSDENEIDFSKKYIALDNVQNPDNLGAISRTAEALGVCGIILESGCDIYNPKAQRASMGSLLRLPVVKTQSLSKTVSTLAKGGMKVYATTPDSTALDITKADMNGGTVLVIGNEANGVSDEVFDVCQKVTIQMKGRAESLNAAMAAAISMWEMVKQTKAD